SDGDAWLCFQCNDCVTYCPVDARPGDVMAAVRNYQMTTYAVPSFLAKASQGLKYLPMAFIIPVILMGILIFTAILYPNGGQFEFPEEERILFEDLISEIHIDIVTLSTLAVVFSLAGFGLYRFWRTISESHAAAPKKNDFLSSLSFGLVEAFTHRRFKECGTNKTRLYAHAAIFYGFIMLVMATTGAFVYTVILPFLGIEWSGGDLSLPLYDPVKIIGNVGGVLLLGGATYAVYMRLTDRETAGSTVYFDWFFIAVLYITAVTGFLLEGLRFSGWKEVAYSSYLVHLLFVYTLFVYFPFSKFAHLMYRIAALTHAKQIGREAGV
ncbi:MAG: (Fe-S)-binding protein, partial [Dehalococcoidia bacterium]